jgi:protein-disulfide isomerase
VRVGPTLEKILAEYPKDVRMVYKQHPLPMHKNAMSAAEAAMAAHAQGKFGAMNDKLMANSTALSREKYLEIAAEIGLDVKKFTNDIDTHVFKASIDAQAAEAMKVGATGTPASFVNGRYLSGAQPYEAFKKIIDEELAKDVAKVAK